MLACFAFCAKDASLALETLRWVRDLGGCEAHEAALVVDADTPYDAVLEAHKLISPCFKSCEIVSTPEPVEGWIPGSDALWKEAALYAKSKGCPFWFHEPDCIPLRSGWLTTLADSYAGCGKPYLGALVSHQTPGFPNPYLEGNAVYPADAWERVEKVWITSVSWTLACAAVVVPQASDTPLIHQLWGEVNNAPSFAENNIPHTNVFCLRQIRPEAVLWHRCKDGSLIRLLRRQLNINPAPAQEITPLFAFSMKDELCMWKALQLMAEMHGKLPRTCVVHFDSNVSHQTLRNILVEASKAFTKVLTSQYPSPKRPYIGWPAAPNWNFLHACEFAGRNLKTPWLWFEGDAVALRPGWLYQVEKEYERAGKTFMGPWIERSHMNGTPSVYPANAIDRFRTIISQPHTAFDMAIKHIVMPDSMNSAPVSVHDRTYHQFNSVAETMQVIKPEMFIYHPCKTGRLVDRMREIMRQ